MMGFLISDHLGLLRGAGDLVSSYKKGSCRSKVSYDPTLRTSTCQLLAASALKVDVDEARDFDRDLKSKAGGQETPLA